MSSEDRNVSMANAIKHYHALFSLPSRKELLILLLLGIPALCGFLYFAYFLSIGKMIEGMAFGLFTLVTPSLILDNSLNYKIGLEDPILTKRRLSGISLFQNIFWLIPLLSFVFLSPLLQEPLPIEYSLSIGFGFGLALRFSTIYSVSMMGVIKVVAISILQPLVSMFFMFIVWGTSNFSLLIMTLSSGILGCLGAIGFLISLNGFGFEKIGMPTFRLFRAFIANWTEGVREPLENYLEDISDEKDLSIVLVAFRNPSKIKAILAVPNFHPGPFKNVGSSHLPLLLEECIVKEVGSLVFVMHGTSGHEHDLPSQTENERFISVARQLLKFDNFSPYATMIKRGQINRGKASCQRFGEGLFVTLTRAPESTEDLPPEAGDISTEFGRLLGFDQVAVVDSHNCINGEWILPQKEVEDVIEAAKETMSESSESSLSRFQVGVSKLYPETYSLEQGMGPSGIGVLVIKMQGSIFCYITLDGNNMVSGLRERILERIRTLGISDGEIVTTDTHMVNALSLSDRGYHPIGEAIDQDLLLNQICEAVNLALEDLEPAEVAWNSGMAKRMKVFGLESLRRQLDFVHDATNYAKMAAAVSYGSCLLILFVLFSKIMIL
jgi:putative membrane protein